MWREFAFMLHHLQNALEPYEPIKNIITDWRKIATALAGPPRKRQLQISGFRGFYE